MSYQPIGESAPLYTLRYDFLPNEALKHDMGSLFQSGTAPDFLFHATKEVYVDAALYTLRRYGEAEAAVRQAMKEAGRPYTFSAVTFRLLRYTAPDDEHDRPTGLVRLSFLPFETESYHGLMDSLNAFPGQTPANEPPRHYMYAEFRPKDLVGGDSSDALTQRLRTYVWKANEKTQTKLFSASVAGLRYTQKIAPPNALTTLGGTGSD